jgi:hypothetical protein
LTLSLVDVLIIAILPVGMLINGKYHTSKAGHCMQHTDNRVAQGLQYLEQINSPLFIKGEDNEAPVVVCILEITL